MINLKMLDTKYGLNGLVIETKKTVKSYRTEDGRGELLCALLEYPEIALSETEKEKNGTAGSLKANFGDGSKFNSEKKLVCGKGELGALREINMFFRSFAENYLAYLEKKLLPALKVAYMSRTEPQKRRGFSGTHMNIVYAKMNFFYTFSELYDCGEKKVSNGNSSDINSNNSNNINSNAKNKGKTDKKNSIAKVPLKKGIMRRLYGIYEKAGDLTFAGQAKKALHRDGEIIFSVVFDIRVSQGAEVVFFRREAFNYLFGGEYFSNRDISEKNMRLQKKHGVLLLTKNNIRKCKQSGMKKAVENRLNADFRAENADGFYVIPSMHGKNHVDDKISGSDGAETENMREIGLYKNCIFNFNLSKLAAEYNECEKEHGRFGNRRTLLLEKKLNGNNYFIHI